MTDATRSGRVLIIGFGSAGHRHLQTVAATTPSWRVAAVSRSHGDKVQPAKLETVFDDIGAAIDWQPDVAILANPAPMRRAAAEQLAAAGIDLLLEKPLAHTSEDGCQIDSAIQRHGVYASVGYGIRCSSWLECIREALLSGQIGRCLSARLTVGQSLCDWRPGTDYRRSVTAQERLGGGALLELSHEIDAANWLLGTPVAVCSQLAKVSTLDLDVEDIAELVIEYRGRDGLPGPIASIHMDLFSPVAKRSIELCGETALLEACAISGRVAIVDADGRHELCEPEPLNQDQMYRVQWQAFLSGRRLMTSPRVSIADALEALWVTDAAKTSSREGRKVVRTDIAHAA